MICRTWKRIKSLPEKTLLIILSVLVGLCSGAAAVVLKKLIDLIRFGLTDLVDGTQSGLLYIIYPGVGMLISLLFVKYVIKDNISHGVTKVLLAVSKNKSKIKPHNIYSSVASSAVTIGFGGSVGAEAPIVYSGAAIGSNVAKAFGLSYKNMTILLGCGAAGAIAGIFKAPLAGVLFALEILFFNISMTSVLPLLLSTITATVVSYLFLGDAVPFSNTIQDFSMGNIPYYIILGIFCGLVSLYFMRTTLRVEDKMRRVVNPFAKWAIGAVALGVLVLLFPPLYGEGYDSLTNMLNNAPSDLETGFAFSDMITGKWALLIFFTLIMLLKVYATAFTNAGGGVGGTFGPTLVTGGFAGFIVARFINLLGFSSIVLPEANFVLVGMAGLMAGVMQAPMTAIFLIAEITGGYELLIPLIITASISFVTIRTVEQYSIYTKRIAQQGDLLTHDSDQAVLTLLNTSDFIERDFATVNMDWNLGQLVKVISESHRNIFPVIDSTGRYQGVVNLDDVRSVMFDTEQYETLFIYNFMTSMPSLIYVDEKMDSVMSKFERTGTWNLPVVDKNRKYIGFISKSKIFLSYREQLQQVSHD